MAVFKNFSVFVLSSLNIKYIYIYKFIILAVILTLWICCFMTIANLENSWPLFLQLYSSGPSGPLCLVLWNIVPQLLDILSLKLFFNLFFLLGFILGNCCEHFSSLLIFFLVMSTY